MPSDRAAAAQQDPAKPFRKGSRIERQFTVGDAGLVEQQMRCILAQVGLLCTYRAEPGDERVPGIDLEDRLAHLRKLRDSRSPDGFDRGLWREFAEMGFAGVLVPEAQGGMGLGLVEAGILMETIGRTLMPSPFFATAVLGARAFLKKPVDPKALGVTLAELGVA